MNFETVRLQDRVRGGAMNIGVGAFNTYRLSGSVSSGIIDDRWSLYGSYSSLQSDGFRDYTSTTAYSFSFLGPILVIAIYSNGMPLTPARKMALATWLPQNLQLEVDPRINLLDPNDKDDFGQRLVQFQHSMQIDKRSSLQSSLYYGGQVGITSTPMMMDPDP